MSGAGSAKAARQKHNSQAPKSWDFGAFSYVRNPPRRLLSQLWNASARRAASQISFTQVSYPKTPVSRESV